MCEIVLKRLKERKIKMLGTLIMWWWWWWWWWRRWW